MASRSPEGEEHGQKGGGEKWTALSHRGQACEFTEAAAKPLVHRPTLPKPHTRARKAIRHI